MGYEERRRLGDVRRINDHYTDKGISNKKEVRSGDRTSYWSCNDH